MHAGANLHIEYIHIGLTLSFIQDVLTEAILSHPKMRMERKIALVKALRKVIWIQSDLFARWYVRDGAEFERDDSGVLVPGVKEVKEGRGCPFETMLSPLGEEVKMEDETGFSVGTETKHSHREDVAV
jgi:hypothetical protein